jgi:acyl dehydratase
MDDVTEKAPLLTMAEGELIGVSDWVMIDQSMIDTFGTVTRDFDPLHMDPAWAAEKGPFGGTVSYGFLTLSLLSHLLRQLLEQDLQHVDQGLFLNYGFNRVRLIAPVPVNGRVRGRFISGPVIEDRGGRLLKTIHATVEIEGQERPALVAEWLSAWVPPAEGGGTKILG